ncbi:MAG: ComEC/Rec2 family competence protein [Firmicutes bacterium]|nr:ComEC/Rec2 family competence protein [Bacillota bacterium]
MFPRQRLTREGLWRRVSGASVWPLAWGLAAACLLPWVVPERWDGQLAGWVWLVIPGGAALVCAMAFKRLRPWALAMLLPLWAGLGLAWEARQEIRMPTGFQEVEGRLSAPWLVRGERRTTRLKVTLPAFAAGQEWPLSLPAEGAPAPAPGTAVRFRGELRSVEPGPLLLGERPLWRARDQGQTRRIHLRSAEQLEVIGAARPSPLLRLQTYALGRFEALGLQGAAKDLWGALTLGYPPAQEEVFSVFAESGTLHTLVVSGLQVTLLMAFGEALWRRLLRRGSTGASLVLGLLYCAVVGFSAPVWRGFLMGLALALGRRSGWKLPPVLTLHGALLLWLVGHPAAGADPGFLLAWFALLGLLWGAEPLAALVEPLFPAQTLARIAVPWFTTLPLLALLHGGAPLWGIAANLFVLPLVAVLTPLCLILTLVPLPGIVGLLGALLTWMATVLLPFFARIQPLATGWLWPWIALVFGWLWLAQRHARLRRTRALTVALVGASLLLLAFRGTGRTPTTMSLEAVDIGQGDALLLRAPGSEATLIDTGPSPWAARRLARTLSRRGVREPLHLVLTHPHGDHAGGFATFVRLWPVASVELPDTGNPDETWAGVMNPGLFREARRHVRGQEWHQGELHFSVRWPPKPLALSDANLLSQVLRVRWRNRDLWLMGDVPGLQERDLLDLGDPGTEPFHRLLKAGHHGAATATDPQWFQALAPDLVLFTAGRHNAFGFPSARTLETLNTVPYGVVGTSFGLRIVAVPQGWRLEGGDGSVREVAMSASPEGKEQARGSAGGGRSGF